MTLDPAFYAEHGWHMHNQDPQDVDACRQLLAEHPSITYLEHETADVRLCSPSGPRTCFRVFGSPLSPRRRRWAFQYAADEAAALWAQIPLDADIVVSHTPPRSHCDGLDEREGCEALRRELWRVRPRLAVCGHVHVARGAERVRWDLGNANVKYKEDMIGHWEDASAGSKRQSRLDLSQRSGEPLLNDGSDPRRQDMDASGEGSGARDCGLRAGYDESEPDGDADVAMTGTDVAGHAPVAARVVRVAWGALAATDLRAATRGQGGLPPTGRSDVEALAGRTGRQETCVVNASIMASTFPYKGAAPERYNKPIAVDIDLPVW